MPSRSTRAFAWPRTRSPSDTDEDEQRGDARNATSSFVRTFAGARATARTSRFFVRAERRPPSPGGRRLEHLGLRHRLPGYGLSVAVDAAESTISHLPLIFWTCGRRRRTRPPSCVFGSM